MVLCLKMNSAQRTKKAIDLIKQADSLLSEAMRTLNGLSPLASNDIVNSQFDLDDAITRIEEKQKENAMKPVKRNAKFLSLCDFSGNTEEQVKKHVQEHYVASAEEVNKFKFLIAYECEDSYTGESHFLLEDRKTGELFEVHASHCSCYGYEGQFTPEKTNVKYLLSNKSGFFNYYESAREWLKKNLKKVLETA